VCDPMSLLRRLRGTHVVVATLKRPPPLRRPGSYRFLRNASIRSNPSRMFSRELA
jgi:hypothetical protein